MTVTQKYCNAETVLLVLLDSNIYILKTIISYIYNALHFGSNLPNTGCAPGDRTSC